MKRKISRQQAIYRVALAGICSAVALLMVWLGVVVRFSTIAFFIAGGIALMVPLSQRYYFSAIMAYIVSAGLSLLIAGDVFSVMGYVIYFGPISLITGTLLNHSDKIKWWLALIIKVVYINLALALLYFVCHTIVIDDSIMDKIDYWMIALVGTIALVAIDYVIQIVYKRLVVLVAKSLRKLDKTPSNNSSQLDEEDEDMPLGDSPFDEFRDTDVQENNPQEGVLADDKNEDDNDN